jgi:hypothetical protein
VPAFPLVPPREFDEQYYEIREKVLGPFPVVRQIAELDTEVRPDRGAWHVDGIDWRQSHLDLRSWPPGIPQARKGLTPWAYRWPRLKNIELSVADLKKRFTHGTASLQSAPHGARSRAMGTSGNAVGRRGRPSRYDWPAILQEAGRELQSSSPPRSQSEFCRRMAQWCQDQNGQEPAFSTLNEKLAKIWCGRHSKQHATI